MDVVSEAATASNTSHRVSSARNNTTNTTTENTTRRTTTTPRNAVGFYQKTILAPDQATKVSEYSQTTVRTLNIIVSIFLTLVALFIFFMVFPLVTVYMYPHAMFSLFPKAKWQPTTMFKTNALSNYSTMFTKKLKSFGSEVEISFHTTDPPISSNKLNIYGEKQALIVLDGEVFPGYKKFFVCRPTQSYAYYSFRDYHNMVKTCYLFVRQITRRAAIYGYGHGIGANILASTSVDLQESDCFMFDRIFLENPILNLLDEMRNHHLVKLVFFIPPLRDFIVSYVIKTKRIDNVDFVQNLLKIPNTRVTIIHKNSNFTKNIKKIRPIDIKKDSIRIQLGPFRELKWNDANIKLEKLGRNEYEVTCAQEKGISLSNVLS